MDADVLISHTTLTLNKGQGHLNWYKNVELSGHYHAKLERDWSVNV